MLVCKLCNRECKSLQSIKVHLRRTHKVSHEQYLIEHEFGGVAPVCVCGCGELTNYFRGSFKTYRQGHFLRVKENQKFLINAEITARIRDTCIKKYGGVAPASSPKVRQKMEQTNLERYGVKNAFSSPVIQERYRQGMVKKYGVENPLQNEEIKEKIKRTCLKRYGVENPSKNKEVVEKIKKKVRLSFEEMMEICESKNYEPMFGYGEYEGVRKFHLFRCEKHDFVFHTSIFNIKMLSFNQCPKCKRSGVSKQEQEVVNFVKSLIGGVQENTYQVIKPKELDVYVPEQNFAIEYHGLFWHSEASPGTFDKSSHFQKFQACKDKNVRLFQFFEDEWREKQGVCKSMLRNALGKIENRVFARKCHVVEDIKVKEFIDDNHLQGNVRYKKSFSLVTKEGDVVLVLTLRKPFTKKHSGSIEIARICTKRDIVVVGGVSKLFKVVKQWCKAEGYETILTYSDCRYSWGAIYQQLGFEKDGHTGLDYFYTDFVDRFNRFKFRAMPGKPEKQVAIENNVCKIYGAGHYRWLFDLS